MSTKPENPYAFPVIGTEHNYHEDGMSLRDYFAGQALAGLCADPAVIDPERAADSAYNFADAMLRQREKA